MITPLAKGELYTWAQILAALGADATPPPFALHRGDQVVGFALNRWQNPAAPHEVLVGYGDQREERADAFIQQRLIVPVLIKEAEGDARWRCAGNFRLRKWTDETAEKNKRVKPFDIPAIYMILFLDEVP
jgi:hypothetical protein